MKLRIHTLSLSSLFLASACVLPPAMLQRAGYGPPEEYWQGQGRYRQVPAGKLEPATAGAQRPEPPGAEAVSTDPTLEDPAGSADLARPSAAAPPLYAWDGGVVDGAPQGAVTEREGAPRGLEQAPAGRTHIIELYQQVLDERDALAQEVELLRKSLDQMSQALEGKTREAEELTAKVAALEASHAALLADNRAIAGRLVTAQIRRLEAEKLLLETRIQIEQARAEEAVQPTQTPEAGARKGNAARPKKPEQPAPERDRGRE